MSSRMKWKKLLCRCAYKRRSNVNVLHVIQTLDIGGAELVVVNLVKRLSPSFRSTICCLKRSGAAANRIENQNVEVIEVGMREGNDYTVPIKLARILKERQIDIVHSHSWGVFCESTLAACLARTPVRIHTAHGRTYQYPSTRRFRTLRSALRHRVERFLASRVDIVTAVSDSVRGDILETIGIPAGKIIVLPNGVDIPRVSQEQVEARRREINLKKDEILLLTVGRLAPEKNIEWLLSCLPQIRQRVDHTVRLVIVGDGPRKAQIERMISASSLTDDVVLLGQRDDVLEWMALADVFVLPSSYEGTSLALLEAMASGLSVVATNVGGNAEVLRNGETGILVEQNSDNALVSALSRLLSDNRLRARLGSKAKSDIRNRYSNDAMIRSYEHLYRNANLHQRRSRESGVRVPY